MDTTEYQKAIQHKIESPLEILWLGTGLAGGGQLYYTAFVFLFQISSTSHL